MRQDPGSNHTAVGYAGYVLATAAAIIQPWAQAVHHYFARSTQPSTSGLSNNNNGDGGCGW